MAGGPLPHLRPSKGPRRPTHWPTRKTSALCPKPGSRWNSSWMVAQPVRGDRGRCSTRRGLPTPGYRTSCPLTWTSGGRSSSWLESPTAPSHFLEEHHPCRAWPRPCGPMARRGPWFPRPAKAAGLASLGMAGCRPHLKCQHLDFCTFGSFGPPVPGSQVHGLNVCADLNPATVPAPGAGGGAPANKVKKPPF